MNWVFLSGQDAEVRQLIFAVELARAGRAGLAIPAHLRQALDFAKTTYEAHIQSASRETLKALADLRKNVVEETQKITQRAQDLTSGLWRDIAVSSAPFVVKVLSDANKAANSGITSSLYFAAAVFIIISFALQTRINGSYLENQKSARVRWFDTLYNHISAAERQRISDIPIEAAENSYEGIKRWVGLIYCVLAAILLGFGLASLPTAHEAKLPQSSVAAPSTSTATSGASSTIKKSSSP